GGDRCPARSTGRRARDRAQDQPRPGHDLARAASKRRYPRREAGVPGLGRAVEGGADGAEAEDREAGREPETTELRPGPAQRRCVPSDGSIVAGPDVPAWKGRSKPRRADRRWVTAWSPE